MQRRSIPQLLLVSLSLSLGCATDRGGATPDAQRSDPPAAQVDDAAVPPAASRSRAEPIELEAWRTIQAQGKAAVRKEALEERIDACRAFAKTHPTHQETRSVLEALADALIDKGDFDAEDLAAVLHEWAQLEEDSTGKPVDIVRQYHLKHGLPLQSGLGLLALNRTRIARDWEDLEYETNPRQREWGELRLHYGETESWVLEAQLQLQADQPARALTAIENARKASDKWAKDIVMLDGQGRQTGVLPGGVIDGLHVLEAAAHQRQGRNDEARQALGRAVGFLDDLELRKIYDETRTALGMTSADDALVTAEAIAAQAFELEGLDGKKVRLSDYRGKVVLVTFWATWCGPCKKELPELQKFVREHRDKGVEVLAISTDSVKDRAKVKPFLEKENLDLKVSFDDPKQLGEYQYSSIPALYVVDRNGNIAHARTGYDRDLKEKLTGEIKELVENDVPASRKLFTIELAPAGFGVRWKQAVSGDAWGIEVGSPTGNQAGEVAFVGREGLTRLSATGESLGTQALSGWNMNVRAADLDGDGSREWIVGGWGSLKVLDGKGDLYWEHEPKGGVEVADVRDLNGDGFMEIITKQGDRVVPMQVVPDPLWKSHPFKELEAVTVGDDGQVVVQADGKIYELDAAGRARPTGREAPKGRTLAARTGGDGKSVDLFKGKWDPEPNTRVDIDGDGKPDVLLATDGGIVAFDASGKEILRVRSHDVNLTVGAGDLDGKPGDELAIAVQHYGVVVLGRKG
jgi:peroxiredoxin